MSDCSRLSQQMPKLLEKGASYTQFFSPKNPSAFQYFAYLSVYYEYMAERFEPTTLQDHS